MVTQTTHKNNKTAVYQGRYNCNHQASREVASPVSQSQFYACLPPQHVFFGEACVDPTSEQQILLLLQEEAKANLMSIQIGRAHV